MNEENDLLRRTNTETINDKSKPKKEKKMEEMEKHTKNNFKPNSETTQKIKVLFKSMKK